ncbi:MAG: hypothetical protein EBZ36_04185 [Acidobacteria bacterium]|nr:hypothetical protein [Acidobacteriota bacterium]
MAGRLVCDRSVTGAVADPRATRLTPYRQLLRPRVAQRGTLQEGIGNDAAGQKILLKERDLSTFTLF